MRNIITVSKSILSALTLTLLLASTAYAGPIIVSGDVNISPYSGTGNATFFQNILGSGTTVRIQGNSTYSSYVTNFDNYYNSLSGVSSTVHTGAAEISPLHLSGTDLFISVIPENSFTSTEVSMLYNFVDNGGTLFLIGENGHPSFNVARNAINDLLAQLGSSMSLGNVTVPNTTAVIASDPLTAGISSFSFIASSGVDITGGTALISNTYGDVIIAYDNVSSATVPEPTSLILLLTGILSLSRVRRKQQI